MKDFLQTPNLFGKICTVLCICAGIAGMALDWGYWGGVSSCGIYWNDGI